MIHRKIGLYIISVALLFLFIIILTIDIPICIGENCKCIGFKELILINIIPIICLLLLLWSVFEYYKFKFDLDGATNVPFKITKIKNINYEHLTFLLTYVIPLVSFDYNNKRCLIVLAILLIAIGVICVKTDLFYANPSLALVGFHVYKVDGNFKNNQKRNGIIVIALSKLSVNDKVSYIKLDDRIFYAKKVK